MPNAAPRLCATCRQLVTEPRCPRCTPAPFTSRRSDPRPGDTRAKRRARAAILQAQPICAVDGCNQLAEQLDHIIAWSQRGDMSAAEWDAPDNKQGLCVDHHREKTQRESRRATP